MNHSIRIAKQLVRIARILVAFNRNELEKQLKKKRSDLDESSLKEHLDCLEKMDAKEQKVALHWINKKNLTLPEDLSKFQDAMNLIKKQHLDFQKFDDPMDVLSRDDKSTLKIRSQDERFNPATEKTFSHPYNAGDGVVIYNVEDSKEGQKAVRRAIDFHFGYDKNFWCLATRYEKYDDDLEEAWDYWKENSAYPKRIAFKNGKLFAFSAGKHKQHVEWWDRDDDSHYDIPESNAVDDVEFLKRYGKINLLENKNASPEVIDELVKDEDKDVKKEVARNPRTPAEVLTKLVENEDEDVDVRRLAVKHPSIPVDILTKLAEDRSLEVRCGVAENPNTPVDILRKLTKDEDWLVRIGVAKNPRTPVEVLKNLAEDRSLEVKYEVIKNPRTPVEVLKKLAEDRSWGIRNELARNQNTPVEILSKLAEDEDWRVRARVAKNPITPVEVLKKLADDGDGAVRCGVAENPRTPVEVLRKLAEDKVWVVRESARKSIALS